MNNSITFSPIGVIRTPYKENAPFQPVENDKGEFVIVLNEQFKDGLKDLDKFKYLYVIYFIHQIKKKVKMNITPPWSHGKKVGLFSSRSPVRPNPIGISTVRLKNIEENKVYISGLDTFDGTPLLDIKPYIKDLDDKPDANYGWIEELDNKEHMALHIKGIPHDY